MPAPYYRVRVRETGADESARWRELPPILSSGAAIEIDGVETGRTYDLRITYVDQDGDESAEAVIDGHEVVGHQQAPPRPDEVVLTGGCLKWRAPGVAPAVVGYLARYVLGEHEDWELMTPAHEGLWAAPPLPLCSIPQGIVTFGIVAVGQDGVQSAPGFATFDRGALDDRDAVTHLEVDHDALGWPGDVVSGTVAGGEVRGDLDADAWFGPEPLDLFGDFDDGVEFGAEDSTGDFGPDPQDHRQFGPDDPGAEFGGDEYIDLIYQPRIVLPGPIARDRTLTVALDVVGPSARLEYRHGGDAFGPAVDGEFGADTGYDELPFGGPEGAAWRPWPGRLPSAGGGLFEFRVTVPGGPVQPKLTGFRVALSAAT